MHSMDLVCRIQDLRNDSGKSYKEIQEVLGISSKTISKALNQPERFFEGYKRTVPAESPVLGKYHARIEELLKGKEWARSRGHRVRRTARWVYRKIRKEGYQGAESTVRTYIRQRFKKPRPACPIEHPPGSEAQFDFGEYPILVGGEVQVIHFVGATFPYSTRRFLFAYRAERQECLFDAIERCYQRAGGVTDRLTLDNTKLAVIKVLKGRRREETENYLRFRGMLGVNPRFTNRAAGWEKGHVEGTIGWAKRQVLLDLEVKDFEELGRILEAACEEDARTRRHGESGRLVCELFEEERSVLRPFPYEGRRSYKTTRVRVSPGGLVFADGSRYSAPITLRGRMVRVRLFPDEVMVTFKHEVVARHVRDWSGRGEHYKIEHYLSLLKKAPALLDHGKPFVRMPEWLKATRSAMDDDKGLVELLLAVDEGQYTLSGLHRACLLVLKAGCASRAMIEQKILLLRSDAEDSQEPLEEAECGGLVGAYRFSIESPRVYDAILGRSESEVG